MVTLVFMMALLMFAVYPAIKIVAFIDAKTEKPLSQKMENFLTLLFTILLALGTAIILKI
jgi:hypothetical protein